VSGVGPRCLVLLSPALSRNCQDLESHEPEEKTT
jgi:hypothetical protein